MFLRRTLTYISPITTTALHVPVGGKADSMSRATRLSHADWAHTVPHSLASIEHSFLSWLPIGVTERNVGVVGTWATVDWKSSDLRYFWQSSLCALWWLGRVCGFEHATCMLCIVCAMFHIVNTVSNSDSRLLHVCSLWCVCYTYSFLLLQKALWWEMETCSISLPLFLCM